jgi:hypothetical protein
MMDFLTIVFDNSPLSRLLEESERDRDAILAGLRTFAVLRVTGMNVIETMQIPGRDLRATKLRLLRNLTDAFNPFQTPNDLLGDIARAYQTHGSLQLGDDMNWFVVNNPDRITDEIAAETLRWHREREKWFREMYEKLRGTYQPLFETGGLPRPENAVRFLKYFISRRETYYDMLLLDIYERHTGERPTHDEFTAFFENKDACGWGLFWLARIYALYQRSIQHERYGWKANAGLHDLDSAIYLPYCDWFVTGDAPQRRAFRLLNALNRRATSIIEYSDLRRRLLVG